MATLSETQSVSSIRSRRGEPPDLELLQHSAAGDALARRRLEQVAEPCVAAGDEVEGAADEPDLDHGGGREALVRAPFDLGAVLETNGVVTEPAGEGRLERGDALFETELRVGRERNEVAGRRHTQV